MPSIAKSSNWFIRVDGPQEHLKEKITLLSVHTIRCLAVFHLGKKGEHPHVHICCTAITELQKQSWDVKIKKIFGIEKAHNYSSKVWDGNLDSEGAGTYLFHESSDSPILCTKGVSEETLQGLRTQSQIINKVVEINRLKAETKIPGKVIEKWIAADKPEWSEVHLVRTICEMARDGECYLPKGDFQWKAYIEEIKLKMSDTPDKFYAFARDTFNRLYNRGF